MTASTLRLETSTPRDINWYRPLRAPYGHSSEYGLRARHQCVSTDIASIGGSALNGLSFRGP